MKTIGALKIGIRNIFESIGCGNDKIEEVNMITESNMLTYLGSIEERTNEILQMFDLCKHKVGFTGIHPIRAPKNRVAKMLKLQRESMLTSKMVYICVMMG